MQRAIHSCKHCNSVEYGLFADTYNCIKAAFHDTDILADIPARIVARMSACRSTFPFSLP